jgi:uncharacterized membrane protein YeaQ/YmgE (transglycosylase-associated protein family)
MCAECFLVTAVIGALLGLSITLVTKTKRVTSAAIDIAVGAIGGVAMAWFVAPLSGNPASQTATTAETVGALFGSLLLVVFSKAIRPNGW